MAADTQRKAYRYTCNMVRPQIYSEKSLMESVVDFFSDVVPQAYTGTQKNEDKEKIQWVRFENCDCNDVAKNPDMFRSDTKGLPLLLILGYSNGVQIWNITPNGEAQEILSMRQGPVRICRMLPNPDPVLGHSDSYSSKRPLVVLCDSSSAGQPYCGVKFVSLKTGDEVHSISFKTLPVQNIECNKRFLVIVFLEKICVHEACQFQQMFWITSCFPCSGPNVNPIALSSRWLAYADKRLVAMHQSCGGMSGDGSQSYAATVLSAAKGAFKGLSMFGEAMVSSVTGTKATPPKRDYVQLDNGNRPGIVTVVDIQNIHNDHFNVNEDNEGDGLIAHFHAHANEPVSNLAFDPTGTLLVTACKLGHNFHVFRLMAHPVSSSLGAVHHLYTLHRGETTAKVIDISFNHDSRWITVSSHRGTTHLFPITPYGGSVNVRTHCKPHVVNRASRFHRSAGLDEFDHSVGRRSPVLSTSPSSSGQYDRYPTLIQQNTLNNNMGNPRLPPYPHPITICPAFQVKQPLNVVLNPGNKNQSPSHSPTGFDNVYCVCAKFCTPRLCVVGSPKLDMERREAGKRPVDSLFVMAQSGTLVEYVLEPRAKSVTDKVTDDCMLELNVVGRMQWNLQRLKNSQELRPPLPSNSPLILAHEAVTSQIPTAPDLYDLPGLTRQDSKDSLSSDHSGKDDSDEQWLSQVEIITHAGPHRRLWMGPQFSFKTYQENTTVLSSTSSSLLSQSPESNMAAMDLMGDEGDLESLKLQPTRSNPVSMPNARPAYRRLSGSDSSPVPGQGVGAQSVPMVIEAGSFDQSPHLLDVYSNWTESSVAKQPRGSDDLEEDRLKETLADAMVESPCKDIEKLSLRHQDIPRTSVKPEKTRSQTGTRTTLGYNDKADVGNVVKGSSGIDADRKVVARKGSVESRQTNMDKKTVKPAKKSSDEGTSIEGSGKCADGKVEGSVVDKSQKGHSELEDNKTNAESNKNGKKKGKAKKSLDSQLKDVSKSVIDEKSVNNTDAAEKVQAPTVESSVSSSSSKVVKCDSASPDKTQSIPESKKPSGKKSAKRDASSPDKTQSIPESKKPSDKKPAKRDVSSPEKTQSFPESKKPSDKKTAKRDASSPDKTQSIPESKKPSDKNGSNSGRYCASSHESTLVLSESKHIEKDCTKPCIDKLNGNECPELISSPNLDTVGMLHDKKSSSGKQDIANLNDVIEKVEMVNKAVDDKSTKFLSEKVVESDGRVSPQKSKSKLKNKKQGKGEMNESVMKTEEAVVSVTQQDCLTSIEVIEGVQESKGDESDDVEKKKGVQFEIVSDDNETQINRSLQNSKTNQTFCEDVSGMSFEVKDTDNMFDVKNDKMLQQREQEEAERVDEQDAESSCAPTKSKKKKKKENVNAKLSDEKLSTRADNDTEKQTNLKDKKTQHDSVMNDDTSYVSFASNYKSVTVSVDVNLEVEETDLEVIDEDIVCVENKSKDTVESKDDIESTNAMNVNNDESKELKEETASLASTINDIDGTKKDTPIDNTEMTEVKSKKKRKKKKNGMDESVYFEKSEAPSKSVDCEQKKTKEESEKSTELALSSAAVPTIEKNCALAPLELSKEPHDDVIAKKLDDSDKIEIIHKADVNSIKTITADASTSKAGPAIKKTNSTEMFHQQGSGQDDYVSLDGEKQADSIESKSSASSKDSDNWFADETVVVQKKKNKKKRKNVESKGAPTQKSPEPEVVGNSIDSESMETLVDNYGSDNTALDNAKSSSSQRDFEVIAGTADGTTEVVDHVELVDPLLNNDDIHGSNGAQLKSIYADDAVDDLSDVKKMEDSAESGSKYETAESAEDDPSAWERSEFEECLEENIVDEIPVDEAARSDKIGKNIVEEIGEDCVKDRKKITFEDQSEANENSVEKQVNQNVESNKRSPGNSDSKVDSNASVMAKSMYEDSTGSSSRSSEEREESQSVKNVNSKAEGKTKKKKRKNKK